MRLICYFSLIFFVFITSCSRRVMEDKGSAQYECEYNFPDDWIGYWEGTLDIYNTKGKAQSVKMAMDIQKTDTLGTYTWAIIYGDDPTEGRRSYYLKEINANKGLYQIDEKNSILINAYLMDDRLISTYEVMSNIITSSYRLIDQKLYFEIYSSSTKEALITGDQIVNNEEIPEVKSYKSTGYQLAILNKIILGQKNTLSN